MSERQAGTFRRATATPAECRMMELLNAAKIPYRWQYEIQRLNEPLTVDLGDWRVIHTFRSYFADFIIDAGKILVEVDGDAHSGKEDYDSRRDAYLESRGYRVIGSATGSFCTRGPKW
jgi:hypothetical protein